MSHSQGTQRNIYKQYVGANKDTLIFWPKAILHDFGKKKNPKNYSNTHFSFLYYLQFKMYRGIGNPSFFNIWKGIFIK